MKERHLNNLFVRTDCIVLPFYRKVHKKTLFTQFTGFWARFPGWFGWGLGLFYKGGGYQKGWGSFWEGGSEPSAHYETEFFVIFGQFMLWLSKNPKLEKLKFKKNEKKKKKQQKQPGDVIIWSVTDNN